MKETQDKVNKIFETHFGRTPLGERLNDILREAVELSRFTDLRNLREETGDLLASTLQLCTECGWDSNKVIEETFSKIKSRHKQYHSLGRKLKIGLLGGAFNPPTVGHIKIAQFVLDTSKEFDEVWIVPAANHMYNKSMENTENRLEMCKIAASIDPRIKVFDYEIQHNLSGETYNFVKRLMEEDFAKNHIDFSVIIGLDNANTFDKWVNYSELERLMRFVVVSREGYLRDPKVDWYLNSPHIYLHAETLIPETSSTEVRKALQNHYSGNDMSKIIRRLIDPLVFNYIIDKNLYNKS